MPRTARKKSKSGIYHVMLRGINRQTIFKKKEDSIKFLETLKKYKEKSGYKLYAYCLMGNHIHLLIKEEDEELGITMRRIGASYVYWYNWEYNRCGHLFQDRFKSEVVEDERYLLTVLRYIHQNPLKAGLVKNVEDYKWSSYCEFINKSKIIDVDFILSFFSNDMTKAIDEFKRFHKINVDDVCLDMEEKKRLKDNAAIEVIKSICNVVSCTEVQVIEKDKRNEYLRVLKKEGLSTRQIARLTGINRNIILKV